MRTSALVIAAALLSLLACGLSFTDKESVEVPGDAAPDLKLALAKEVATQVWEAGFRQAVQRQFPDLTDSELDGLGIRWNTFTLKPIVGDLEPKTTVSIQCIFQQKRALEFGKPIVKFCKELVEKALQARISKPSAA
jgi:hypothetical protein